jgi:hypothetical protein
LTVTAKVGEALLYLEGWKSKSTAEELHIEDSASEV